tara:strand:+ start:1219 stop:1332 length:114 start_codon:yes stop_codon:yes gene_type:complete
MRIILSLPDFFHISDNKSKIRAKLSIVVETRGAENPI